RRAPFERPYHGRIAPSTCARRRAWPSVCPLASAAASGPRGALRDRTPACDPPLAGRHGRNDDAPTFPAARRSPAPPLPHLTPPSAVAACLARAPVPARRRPGLPSLHDPGRRASLPGGSRGARAARPVRRGGGHQHGGAAGGGGHPGALGALVPAGGAARGGLS